MTAEEFADILDRNLDIIIMLKAAAQTEGTPAERLWLDGYRAGIEGAIEQMRAISWRGDLASSPAVPPSETGPADDAIRTTGHETGLAAHDSNAATTAHTTDDAPHTKP